MIHSRGEVNPSKFFIISLILLIFINLNVVSGEPATIVINEIMYNPEQNDNYNEWIELYNPTNHSINVSGWSITDNYAEDFLEGDRDHGNGTTIIPAYGYAIIADHGTKIYENYSISNETIKLYVDDLSIGNGLGNEKDKLILKNSTGTIIDAMEWGEDYPDVAGYPAALVDVNHSLSRYPDTDTNDSSMDFYDGVRKYFPDAQVSFEPDLKRQVIVDSWPADLDDTQAQRDWDWHPDYDLERSFSEYLVPNIKRRYRGE